MDNTLNWIAQLDIQRLFKYKGLQYIFHKAAYHSLIVVAQIGNYKINKN